MASKVEEGQDGFIEIERSYETSRLSGQLLASAYEIVAPVPHESSPEGFRTKGLRIWPRPQRRDLCLFASAGGGLC